MMIVASVVAVLCSLLCIGNTMNKTADRFEKIFFSLMAIVFLVLCVLMQVVSC